MIFPIVDIKFRKIHPAAVLPEYKTLGSIGMDLHLIGYKDIDIATDIFIYPHRTIIARTGLGIYSISDDMHAEIYLRSSVGIKYPGLILANHIGIIDVDYTGPEDEIYLLLHNTSNQDIEIERDARIAQLVLRKSHKGNITEFIDENRLPNGSRPTGPSRGGLGSTG